jgi:hypothetical protein
MIKPRADLVDARITAHHEGGHGCSAIVLGLKFESIDIIHDPDDNLRGQIKGLQHDDSNTVVDRRIIVLHAGAMAQRRYAPTSAWHLECSGDRLSATARLQEMYGEPPQETGFSDYYDDESGDFYGDIEYLPGRPVDDHTLDILHARYRIRAAVLVNRLWPQIRIMARELFHRKVLSFDEVRRLMNRARRLPRSKRS